jgi:hypothetical protein
VTGLRYFGKSIREDIHIYTGSGKYWSNHFKKHGKTYIVTEWVSEWFETLEEIKEFALAFSEIFDIVNSDEWANLQEENGLDGNSGSKITAKKASDSMKITFNDPEWKASTGIIKSNKLKTTINSQKWIEEVGNDKRKRQSISLKITQNDPEWKASTGKRRVEQQSISLKITQNDPEWIKKNYKKCEHCGAIMPPGSYARWHGNNCKLLK